jgi:hypothetical protein
MLYPVNFRSRRRNRFREFFCYGADHHEVLLHDVDKRLRWGRRYWELLHGHAPEQQGTQTLSVVPASKWSDEARAKAEGIDKKLVARMVYNRGSCGVVPTLPKNFQTPRK